MPQVTSKKRNNSKRKPVKVEIDGAPNVKPPPGVRLPHHQDDADRARAYRHTIRVRGAREHNLKGVDIDIPRDRLVVVTGLSGSGKSSLAFDTIFAEGQRKYMESLSAYARQFLDQLKKPDVEDIEGLPPTIAIEQRSSGHNPRSTVATSTEIYDYLRLLFARCGTPTCWSVKKSKKDGSVVERCGLPIASANPSQITDAVSSMSEGTRLMVLAPVVRTKKGFHKEVVDGLIKQGFIRARVNGVVTDLREAVKDDSDNPLGLGRYEQHTIEAVVDRIVVKAEGRQRLAESVETALRVGGGVVVISVETEGAWADTVYSEHYACTEHPECSLEELEPRLFSFNSPHGACPTCHGIGSLFEFDEELVCPDWSLSIAEGGVDAWHKAGPFAPMYRRRLRKFCRVFGVDERTPIAEMSDEDYEVLLRGGTKGRNTFEGVLPGLRRWYEKSESTFVKDFLGNYMAEHICPDCAGDRLRIEALSVFIPTSGALSDAVIESRKSHGLTTSADRVNISDFTRLNIDHALGVIEALNLTEEQQRIAEPIVREVRARLGFLASVGLEYLNLDRKTATLSGGEAQRIRLATQVGSGLVGACYVLDEPTIGLHQRDNARLIKTLRHLADIGNTVIVVEHDEEMIRSADHLIDIGPGPGVHGGRIVAQGTAQEVADDPASITGQYLSGERSIDIPTDRRKLNPKKAVTIKGARENNLKNVDATFPLGGMTCVTGVSGSGKSTLVNDILLRAAKKELHGSKPKPGAHTRINGLHKIDRIIEVDQSPIGRTPRSNPATYTGMFDDVRKLFTQAKESKIRGYQPGRFSFNVKGGRCEACQGQGVKKIEMHFLPDVFVECEVCHGTRYNRETLEVTYRGKNIAQVLDLTVEDACGFFENHPKILRFAECLRDVGLGYIKLGQPSTTLSGGEAQRIKLATELGKGNTLTAEQTHTLYILDEPTTGLHFEDVAKLITVLNRLADQANTLVVIEHNLDVIKCADWLIDLGPEGGDNGGMIVAAGTPEDVARVDGSHTGRYLAEMVG